MDSGTCVNRCKYNMTFASLTRLVRKCKTERRQYQAMGTESGEMGNTSVCIFLIRIIMEGSWSSPPYTRTVPRKLALRLCGTRDYFDASLCLLLTNSPSPSRPYLTAIVHALSPSLSWPRILSRNNTHIPTRTTCPGVQCMCRV